jgi:hypothetical protein
VTALLWGRIVVQVALLGLVVLMVWTAWKGRT